MKAKPRTRLVERLVFGVTIAGLIPMTAWGPALGGVLPTPPGRAFPSAAGPGTPTASAFLSNTPDWTADPNQDYADFGSETATAGDVNGDGYSDVIVGAPGFENGEADEGRAYLYLGSALGLATTPDWIAESNQVNAGFGTSVAGAGDVNRDGFDDVIVGAPYFDNGQDGEGRAFLYLGSAQGLGTSPAWTAESNQPMSFFGSAVTAGDINGDGISDVVVSAIAYDRGELDEGRIFAFRGSAQGLSVAASWTVESNQASCAFGSSMATPDVNGDGFDDLLVGAWQYDNGQIDEGRAFLYPGSPTGLASTPGWTVESNQVEAFLGESVATGGDVNGDGYADVIVGASGWDNMENREGKASVYAGSAQGLGASPIWTVESNLEGATFGAAVATAGDVTGDGLADVIVSATSFSNGQFLEGKVFLYLSGNQGLATIPAWTLESNQGLGATTCVATAGDVNGDGFSDLLLGARSFSNGELYEGSTFVFHGSALNLSTQFFYSYSSFQTDAWFGVAVAGAGDVNGDGYSDAVVGAPNYDGGETDEGRAYVLYGDDSGVVPLECNQAAAQLGSSVAGAGDVNGDGYPDVIAGAPNYTNGQSSEGRAFLYLGSAGGITTTPAWTAESNQAFANFGGTVAGAGDVNGDGYSDVLVAAQGYSNGQSNEGRCYLYLGSASGLSSAPAWTAESNQPSSGFGSSLGTAGDVNGDGFSDVIVGAYLYDNGQSNEGRAFVYHGSAAGLSATPSWTFESNQALSDFGISVATAGDVNADGYSDVLIGADAYDNNFDDEGRVYLFLGGDGGLLATPNWTGDGWADYGQFGFSIASAGDVNLDGYSDFLVGAPFYDNGRGGAALYYGSVDGGGRQVWTVTADQPGAGLGYSVAGVGDFTGDGFADVIVGAPYYDLPPNDGAGRYFGYMGNDRRFDRPGPLLQQVRVNSASPIAVRGNSDYQNAFALRAEGLSAAGRGRVWLEWEVKPFGVPFDGQGLGTGRSLDTGPPAGGISRVRLTETILGLQNGGQYCWRARIASDSPFFPRTPWIWRQENAVTELDLRTTGAVIGVQPAPPAHPFALEPIHPNPFQPPAEIAYVLGEIGAVELAIYDVQGRLRVLLEGGAKATGRHVVPWDGRFGGHQPPAGVYFVRLTVNGRVATQKLVLAP